MNIAHKINRTSPRNSARNPVWMDGLRVLLGLFLFLKGIFFLEYSSDVLHIFSQGQDFISLHKATLFTSAVHIIGGLMITFGVLTRLALLCQIPVILGSMLIVNPTSGLYLDNTELWLSVAVLGLLLFYMVMGPGRYSVDNKVFRKLK
ncbi:DoxX family protein [Pontibacter anaerobius]|uniref:DoxX family protein n=1 Tax=Pontibacter anaerobius TaxID=2993940 RepID=A0ABT3RET0_9BACT|nr:DoxX family protein [Pontibacter anaerobius]MCX2740357.1 DoxX family protein [Pontibacter anaerobius]